MCLQGSLHMLSLWLRSLPLLQCLVKHKLALTTIRSRISALAVLFQSSLGTLSLILTFACVVLHVASPVCSQLPRWKLHLVFQSSRNLVL